MLITKIEDQKNKERINIYIDGTFAFGLEKEIKFKYGLYENMSVDQAYIDNIILEEEFSSAKNQALKFLSYRQRTKREIVDKLREKDYDESIIEKTILFLKEYRLVDDREFSKSFMADKVKLNKYGPGKIKYDLLRKGIKKEIIDEVLGDYDDELSIAMELAEKRLPSYEKDSRQARYRKLAGFLQRRGFSYDCINKVLRELLD